MKKVQQGFTLIELMIVVAIIGILAAIAIPQYQTFIAKSQVSRAVGESGAIKTAVEDCLNNGQVTAAAFGVAAAAGECDLGRTGSSIMSPNYPEIAGNDLSAQPLLITATLGNKASTAVSGNIITWSRSDAGSWTCTSDALAKYNTAACQ